MANPPLDLIDDLQIRYIRALDRKDMDGWLATFAKDGSYVVIPAENEESGLPLALMMDDCYERLVDRVGYVTKVWSFDEYQMRHFVQRIQAVPEGDAFRVESNFSVFYTDQQGKSGVLAIGRYEDLITVANGTASFRSKRVVYDNFVLPTNLVYPI